MSPQDPAALTALTAELRGYEERILDPAVRADPAQVRALLESRDFYGPERYARALEHAGVTRSLMNVLAIEQGRTNALFELSPRHLLQYVLEMLGAWEATA